MLGVCAQAGSHPANPEAWAMKRLIATLVISLIQFGCASAPVGDPQQDAELTELTVAPDNAGLFIYRNQTNYMGVSTDLWLDGTPLGQTTAKTYLYTPVAPGRHDITSNAGNTDTLEVDFKAGSMAYVRQEVEFAADPAQVRLYLVSEEEGRNDILDCKLVVGRSATQDIEVNVEADDPAWAGPLECQASNTFGIWKFTAPGTVTVHPAFSPLSFTCSVPAGSEMEANATVRSGHERVKEGSRKGAGTGAKIGAGAGVAAGLAAAPVMGPLFAVALVVGGAFQGAEVGGMIGSLNTGVRTWEDALLYPSPIAIHIRRMSEPD